MISYRFRRRAFLGALGGGLGLKVMLRNAELSAQSTQSPPRFLVTYWPLAIVAGAADALWKPTQGAAGGHALQTFLDHGLGDDMITVRGLNTGALALNGGGPREGGSVVTAATEIPPTAPPMTLPLTSGVAPLATPIPGRWAPPLP